MAHNQGRGVNGLLAGGAALVELSMSGLCARVLDIHSTYTCTYTVAACMYVWMYGCMDVCRVCFYLCQYLLRTMSRVHPPSTVITSKCSVQYPEYVSVWHRAFLCRRMQKAHSSTRGQSRPVATAALDRGRRLDDLSHPTTPQSGHASPIICSLAPTTTHDNTLSAIYAHILCSACLNPSHPRYCFFWPCFPMRPLRHRGCGNGNGTICHLQPQSTPQPPSLSTCW